MCLKKCIFALYYLQLEYLKNEIMKVLLKSLTVVSAVFCIVGCSSKDVYDEQAVEEKEEATYADYFQKKYPDVDLNQDWDYTTGQELYSLPSSGSGTRALTRGDESKPTIGEFTLDGTVSKFMHENMEAGKNNSGKGNPFYMTVPPNPFTIVPIFQGTASYIWELWMYVETVGDIKIWSKGEGLSYQETKDGAWTQIVPGKDQAIPEDVYQVKSKSYTFTGLPTGKTMYFYLKVTNKNNMICSSLNQMMLTLNGFEINNLIKNLPEGNEAMIVGCEDNPDAKGDWDYEDMAFMVYGNPTPPVYEVDERIISNGKRYMMEDLGAMDDFDFNDIVVDVYDRTKEILYYEVDADGNRTYVPKKSKKETLPTMATVRAMGGTLDFTLTIGNTTWTKSESPKSKSDKFNANEMYNTRNIEFNKVLDEFEVSGWNYGSNNVSVTVVSDGKERTIKFPPYGTAPMMIAVDPTTEWMTERTSIPESWLDKNWWKQE